VQLSLSLDDPQPRPETAVWKTLSERQREAIIALLARLIANVAAVAARQESDDERQH
jgi:predicted Fe-S protein YdhL (DUF1289 family)